MYLGVCTALDGAPPAKGLRYHSLRFNGGASNQGDPTTKLRNARVERRRSEFN